MTASRRSVAANPLPSRQGLAFRNHGDLAKAELFTVGAIARLLGCASRTATKWIDSGLIRGHRLPGSLDRRVCRDDLLAFCREHGFTRAAEMLGQDPATLLIGCEPEVVASVRGVSAVGAFAAGAAFERHHPSTVVIDCQGIGRSDALHLCRVLLGMNGDGPQRIVVLLADDNPDGRPFADLGATALRRPVTAAVVAKAVTS